MPDYGASQGGQGQMIQMITALSEMQDRRKQLELQQQQMNQQRDQFIQQMGVTKEDQHFKAISKLTDIVMEGGASAASAAQTLAPMFHLSGDDAQRFVAMAPSAQTALQQVQAHQVAAQTQSTQIKNQQDAWNLQRQQAGYASLPSDQQTQADRAILLAQQAGSPGALGQLGSGGLIGQMANNATAQITPGSPSFDSDMAKRLSIGYGIHLATGETPGAFHVGQAGIDAGMSQAAASIGYGLTPSAGQVLQSQSEQARILGDLLGRQSAANATDMKDSSDVIAQMRTTAEAVANKTYADKNTRDHLIKQYNAYARLLQSHGIQVDIMDPEGANAGEVVGRIAGWMKGITGTNAPPSAPPPPMGSIPGGVGGGMGGAGTGPRPPGGF